MNLFRKIFSTKTKSEDKNADPKTDNKFLPKKEQPEDELFSINFNNNGGKFLYCENMDEIFHCLHQILDENQWQGLTTLIFNKTLLKQFKDISWDVTTNLNSGHIFFTTCEYLIADNGSILISSNQIAEKKLPELPINFIVFASTSQIVRTIGEGLRGIKTKNRKKIPSNITTIKHFKIEDEKNFLSYGSSAKNLYLLLLEDL